MKSLKEFKSAFKVGDQWECLNSMGWKGQESKTIIRNVGIVQSNAVGFETYQGEKAATSWLYWPKASQLTFLHDLEGTPATPVFKGVRVENDVIPGQYLIYRKINQ